MILSLRLSKIAIICIFKIYIITSIPTHKVSKLLVQKTCIQ